MLGQGEQSLSGCLCQRVRYEGKSHPRDILVTCSGFNDKSVSD